MIEEKPELPLSKRSEERDSVFLLASACRLDGSARVPLRVRNLSAGGLMADASDAIAEGDQVRLELRGLDPVEGRVMWKSRDRLGIAFDRPVDPRRAWKTVSGERLPPVPHGGIQRRPALRGG